MSNLPFLSNLSRPVMLALSAGVVLVIVAALLFAAVPRGSGQPDVASQERGTMEVTEIATERSTTDTAIDVATPDEEAVGDATSAGATPATATLAASTPSALIGGGWGSGPEGDAGGMRSYPGPGPQGDVDVTWKLEIPEGYEAGPPVVYGNRLLVTATSEAFGSNLTVYELESGQFLWSYAENGAFSDPFVATGRVFVTADDSLVSLSLETGEVLWTKRLADDAVQQDASGEDQGAGVSDPVADGNAVVVTTGSRVVALDAETGTELWWHEVAGTRVYTPRLVGDIVFVTSVSTVGDEATTSVDRYHGLSLSTGNEIWRQDAVRPEERVASADAGVVLIGDYRGGEIEPMMFDARTGSPVRIAAACGFTIDTPHAVGETVACGGFDALTGEPLAGLDTRLEESGVAATTDDTVYLTSATQIIAVDLASGETRWSLDLAEVGLDDGLTLMAMGWISVGDNGLAIEVWLDDAESEMFRRAIWIIGAASEPAATPAASGTPVASPVASATPEGGQ